MRNTVAAICSLPYGSVWGFFLVCSCLKMWNYCFRDSTYVLTYTCIRYHVQCSSVFEGFGFYFLNFFLADIAQRYRISKYPTLKLFRNGMMMKREYRGQRSVTAIADYIRQQKSNPIREVQDLEEISSLDVSLSILFLLNIFLFFFF